MSNTSVIVPSCSFFLPRGQFDLSTLGPVYFATPTDGWRYYASACELPAPNTLGALCLGVSPALAYQTTLGECLRLGGTMGDRVVKLLVNNLGVAVHLGVGDGGRHMVLEVVCSNGPARWMAL